MRRDRRHLRRARGRAKRRGWNRTRKRSQRATGPSCQRHLRRADQRGRRQRARGRARPGRLHPHRLRARRPQMQRRPHTASPRRLHQHRMQGRRPPARPSARTRRRRRPQSLPEGARLPPVRFVRSCPQYSKRARAPPHAVTPLHALGRTPSRQNRAAGGACTAAQDAAPRSMRASAPRRTALGFPFCGALKPVAFHSPLRHPANQRLPAVFRAARVPRARLFSPKRVNLPAPCIFGRLKTSPLPRGARRRNLVRRRRGEGA